MAASSSTAAAYGPSAAKKAKLSHALRYDQGLHLAPMVRCGTLPTRLLSLDYGATLVWGPEIIDRAMIGAQRTVDEKTGTVQYIKNGRSVWETHPIEKSRLIYQIGSSDPDLALQAAQVVQQDVSGIDLNCGCPKDFSLKGGMGAALLKEPEKLCSILRNLVSNLTLPVSAKIRLLPEQEPTLDLVRQIASTGISNLTVHCRTQTMRDREPALLHRLREIVDTVREYGIPVVANGDCWGAKDRERICSLTGVTAIMIARGAEANPSCFHESKALQDPIEVIIPRYARIAHYVNNPFGNTKYCLNAMDFSGSNGGKGKPGSKDRRKQLKTDLSRVKEYKGLFELLAVQQTEVTNLDELLPGLRERLKEGDTVIQAETREDLGVDNDGEEEELKHKLPANGSRDVTTSNSASADALATENGHSSAPLRPLETVAA